MSEIKVVGVTGVSVSYRVHLDPFPNYDYPSLFKCTIKSVL